MARVYVAVHWILPWRHMKSPPARRFPATSGAAARTSSQPLRSAASRSGLASFVVPARDRPRRDRHRALRRARAPRGLLRPHADPLGRPLDGRVRAVVPVRRPRDGARVLAGGAVRRARAARRLRADRLLARRRRAARARVRARHRATTSHTFGLIPTALVIATVLDGLLRASYETISREALHILGVRRRAIVVGEGEHLEHLLRTLGSARGGIDYEFVGVVSGERGRGPAAARRRRGPSGRARGAPRRRADRHRLGLLRPRAAPDRRARAPLGREGADRAEDDRAARPARRVRPGAGRAALRAPAAGLRGRRLGGEADVRPRRQRASRS